MKKEYVYVLYIERKKRDINIHIFMDMDFWKDIQKTDNRGWVRERRWGLKTYFTRYSLLRFSNLPLHPCYYLFFKLKNTHTNL